MPEFAIRLTCALLVLLPVGSPAQPLEVHRLEAPVELDGRLLEPFWASIPTIPVKMQVPDFGKEPTQDCRIRMAYDDHYLYLSGDFRLEDSSLYRPTTFKRDVFDPTTDYFGLLIDSYNDKENALGFFTTPTGLRWDGTVSNDAQAEGEAIPLNIEWNTFWDAATSRTPQGWQAEIRIPWTSLRFQDNQGEVVMGITIWWYLAAKNEVVMYPLIPLDWGEWSAWKSSLMTEYRFEGIFARKPLYFTPYVLAGLQQDFELNEEGSAYTAQLDPTTEAGFDLKYSLTSNLTLDLTLNTDFAQVEADDEQVNLTRFSLFFPEKRLFFQERSSIFDFNFEGFNRLFYSRRIGLDDDGNPVRILGGARLVGRVGHTDLGFLNMQTGRHQGRPGENFTLMRARRRVINENTYAGLFLLNRTDFEGNFNRAAGLDGIFRIFGDEYLTARAVQTFTDSLDNALLQLESSRLYLNWQRRKSQGLNYSLTYSRAGADYRPEMGFELREDFTYLEGKTGYGWLFGENSPWLSLNLEGRLIRVTKNADGSLESGSIGGMFFLNHKQGWVLFNALNRFEENLSEPFELSDDAQVPPGSYAFVQWDGLASTPMQDFFGASLLWSIGAFYDGHLQSLTLSPRLKLSAHFTMEGTYQFNRARFASRMQGFHSHLLRLKALYMRNTRLSISAFVQYNSLDAEMALNLRLRYNPREGNDLYLVYNDLLNHRRNRERPHLPFSSSRVLALKYTYTFRWVKNRA